MVKHFKSVDGISIKLGEGTTRIHSYLVKSRPTGQIEMSTCFKVIPGIQDNIVKVPLSPKVVLDFSTRESIDILIKKLNDLKDQMEEASYG